jgi:hypothetical protein
MTAHCCARRVSGVTASILPGALLVLLPKCPLCFAAWLTLATGVSFSEAGAVWLRGSIVVFWIVALASTIKYVAGAPLSRRAFSRVSAPSARHEVDVGSRFE